MYTVLSCPGDDNIDFCTRCSTPRVRTRECHVSGAMALVLPRSSGFEGAGLAFIADTLSGYLGDLSVSNGGLVSAV